MAVHSTGKIILGGDFTSVGGTARNHFARLKSDGSLDVSFNIGAGANGTVRSVAVQADSAAVIGGEFTQVAGITRNRIARIHGDEKSNLSTFEFSSATYSVAEDAGSVLITVRRLGDTNRNLSIRFATADGTATGTGPNADYTPTNNLLSFPAGVVTKTFSVRIIDDLVIEGNETVLLSLTNLPLNAEFSGPSAATLTIVDNEKSIQFAQTNYVFSEGATNALITLLRFGPSNGVVSVEFTTSDGTATNGLDYTNVTTTVTFGDGVTVQTVLVPLIDDGETEDTETVLLTLSNPQGVLLGLASATLTILDNEPAPGGVEPTFTPGAGGNNFVRSLTLMPDRKVLLGGAFTSWDNTNRGGVARLNTNGTHDLTFNPGTGANELVASVAAMGDGRVVVGGSFTNFNGAAFNRIVRLTTNGMPDTSYNQIAGFDTSVNVVNLQTNGRVLVGGGFSLPTHAITRLRANGGVDTTFVPGSGANGPVHAVLPLADGRILIGGAFTSVNGVPVARLAMLNSSGLVDESFVPAAITNGAVYALAVQSDGKFVVGGQFLTVGGSNRHGIAVLNSDGTLFTGFNPGLGVSNIVFAIGLQSSGRIIIGGDFTSVNGTNRNRFARLNSNGTLDFGFDPGLGANSTVYTLAVLPDDNIIIGGDFSMVNGYKRNGVAKINGSDRSLIITGISAVAGGPAHIRIRAVPGFSYALEGGTDLIGWTSLTTNTATGISLMFTDPAAAGFSYRFYRVRQVSP